MSHLGQCRALADAAVTHGRWMIRADNDGLSPNKKAGGFHWPEPGAWVRAADFNSRQECGGGLHGQDRSWGGYGEGRRLVFCEWRGGYVGGIDGNKMKAEEARILLVGELPAGLICDGSLGLSGCDLTGVTLPRSVGGSLDLRGCNHAAVAPPRSVGGSLHLSACDPAEIALPRSVGGSLYLNGRAIAEASPLPLLVRSKTIHSIASLYQGARNACHTRLIIRSPALGAGRQ